MLPWYSSGANGPRQLPTLVKPAWTGGRTGQCRSEERPALVHQSSLRVLTRLARRNRGGAMPDPLQDAGTVSRPPE